MPSNIKIRVNNARNLPIMDYSKGPALLSNLSNHVSGALTTDAYVTVSLGGHKNWIEHASIKGDERVYQGKVRAGRQ